MQSRIAGIPCQIEVTYFYSSKGTYSRQAETPDEYYGCTEIEFNVLDRKGYPAPWLEKKMTQEDRDRIEQELTEQHKDALYCDTEA